MRLSEWRKTAPYKEALGNPVLAVVRPVLVDLGAEADADCWVAWGDDPESRYSILAPTVAGLITVAIRMTGPDGTRATGKLIRWSKVTLSELGVESSGGHRLVAAQVESLVLKGVDEEADRICEFVRGLIAGVDGRNQAPIVIQQVAAALGAPASMAGNNGESARDAQSKAPARRSAADGTQPRAAVPEGHPAPKAVPGPLKAVTKAAQKPAGKPAALALVPSPEAPSPEAPAVTPAVPATPPVPPTPIAARAAAAQHGGAQPAPASPAPSAPEPDMDRSAWVGPHPIEEPPARDPARPRPWAP